MDIRVLSFVEAVRARPGMYVGSLDARGAHFLLWSTVAVVLDEGMSGRATTATIVVDGEEVEVSDDGRSVDVACADAADVQKLDRLVDHTDPRRVQGRARRRGPGHLAQLDPCRRMSRTTGVGCGSGRR